MTFKLSCAIMAHPDRQDWVWQLRDRIDLPEVTIAWDECGEGRWATGRRAWLMHDPTATHHLVIQDDALVCQDFVPGVLSLLNYVPAESLVSLYLSDYRQHRSDIDQRLKPLLASLEDRQGSFLVLRSLLGGVAIMAPVYTIKDMVPFSDELRPKNYDWRVGWYYHKIGWDVWFPWPSPVDHRHGPSLCGHQPVQAINFLGEDASALECDWTGPAIYGKGAGVFEPKRKNPKRDPYP